MFSLKKDQIILNKTQLINLINKLKEEPIFAFNIETNDNNDVYASIIGFSFATMSDIAVYIPMDHDYLNTQKQLNIKYILNLLKCILENKKIFKVGFNIKYNYSVLQNYDIELQGKIFDIRIESYVLDSTYGCYDLECLSKRWLQNKGTTCKNKSSKNTFNFNQTTPAKKSYLAIKNIDTILQLHLQMWPKLQEHTKLMNIFQNLEMPLVPVLSRIERNGVKIDPAILRKYSQEISLRLYELEKKAYDITGESFNLFSTKQLQTFLFERQGIRPLQKTPSGIPSTSEKVLEELSLNYQLPKVILEYRRLAKLKHSYTDKLPILINQKTGRVHTTYNQTITSTGRLSSTHPNLQNIPVRNKDGRQIRKAFIASEDYLLISADYSQIELRILAHFSQDKKLLASFFEGKDIHCITAAEIFGLLLENVTNEHRRNAKTINFGLIYGMSTFGLSRQLNISIGESKRYIDRYFNRYSGVLNYIKHIQIQAKKNGYVETLDGRRLYLTDIKSRHIARRASAKRAAINAPIQGTAADIIKYAMVNIDSWIIKEKPQVRMIMQVHDELVFEVHKKENLDKITKKIHKLMENSAVLDVPLLVEIKSGNNWNYQDT